MGNDPAEHGTDTAYTWHQGLDQLSVLAQQAAEDCTGVLAVAIVRCLEALRAGRKLLCCGNGGSAAMASHLAAELMGQFQGRRMQQPAIALTADAAVLTAVANDADYAAVFAWQVETLGQPGDVLIALSTSGQSPNVLAAIETALACGMGVVLLTGAGVQGAARDIVTIAVPSTHTQRIQEIHLALLHALVQGIQEAM